MNNPIRIMLIEDHPQYRETIELALSCETDLSVVATFGAAEIALRNLQDPATRTDADLILLDLNLPVMSGIQALPLLKELNPDTKIIVLTQSDMRVDILHAIQHGADGYLLKSSSIEEIADGIRTVINGGASLDSSVANLIIKTLQNNSTSTPDNQHLTNRETDILKLLSQGFLKKEIADQLDIAPSTVAEHVKRIYKKLNVQNAPAAISRAYKTGILNSYN